MTLFTLLILGALSIALGCFILAPAVGFIITGLELVAAAYLLGYIHNHADELVNR